MTFFNGDQKDIYREVFSSLYAEIFFIFCYFVYMSKCFSDTGCLIRFPFVIIAICTLKIICIAIDLTCGGIKDMLILSIACSTFGLVKTPVTFDITLEISDQKLWR